MHLQRTVRCLAVLVAVVGSACSASPDGGGDSQVLADIGSEWSPEWQETDHREVLDRTDAADTVSEPDEVSSQPSTCTTHQECAPGYCQPKVKTCVECLIDSHCQGGLKCINYRCQDESASCTEPECQKFDLHCNTGSGRCVDCVEHHHCRNGWYCGASNQCLEWACVPARKWCDGTVAKACAVDGSALTMTQECDDGKVCTVGDICVDGVCRLPQERVCDDFNQCTVDSCDPVTGCVFQYRAGPCSDGDACTVGDSCLDGSCVPGERVCECADDQHCEAKDDDDLCNGRYHCINGHCVINPSTVVHCPEDTVCRTYLCNPGTGVCQAMDAPDLTPCDDVNLCTENDHCQQGLCKGAARDCNDFNLCTNDLCTPQSGCVHVFNTLPCNDQNECTVADACFEEACVGTPRNCNDLNDCTADSCHVQLGCINSWLSGVPCDDKSACTTGDTCVQGTCTGTAVVCNDQNLCTTDSCVPQTGCVHTPNSLPCDDGNPCTVNDHCFEGQCLPGGTLYACDDGNLCTIDSCNLDTGLCVHTPFVGSCSDADPCTIGDQCQGIVCVPGPQRNCHDGNECTVDSCNTQGNCNHVPRQGSCSDGNECTVGDSCIGGNCIAGAVLNCNDYNICTTDSCVKETGCVYQYSSQFCDDGDKCTLADICVQGQCVGGAAVNCDNGNSCTDDHCDSQLGCQHVPNARPCQDGNHCTGPDFCASGVCVSGPSVVCNDNNPCTNDSCDPQSGCKHIPNGNSCEDGNPCTFSDKCSGGVCVSGAFVVCDDNNPCTDNVCDYTHCVYPSIPGSCNDGNPCTLGDSCSNGFCGGTAVENCGCSSVRFNGQDSYGLVSGDVRLTPPTAMTIEAWVRLAQAKKSTILAVWDGPATTGPGAGHRAFRFDLEPDGSLTFKGVLSNNSALELSAVVTPYAGWHHVAVSYDGTRWRLYVDGQKKSDKQGNLPLKAGTSPWVLGGVYSGPGGAVSRWFDGNLDEWRISSVARYTTDVFTPLERMAVDTSTVAAFDADQGQFNVLFDNSPNGFHVRLFGGWSWSALSKAQVCLPKVNYPPTAPGVQIVPSAPRLDEDLWCQVVFPSQDLEFDEVQYSYRWYRDGVLEEGQSQASLAASLTQPCPLWDCSGCETWTCEAIPSDGQKTGPSTAISAVVGTEGCGICSGQLYADRCYQYWEGKLPYALAAGTCESWGGYLVSIGSAEEDTFVQSIMKNDGWIGLNELEEDGIWVWESGEALGFTNWAEEHPVNEPVPLCAVMCIGCEAPIKAGEWLSQPCDNSLGGVELVGFVCEKEHP